MNEIGEAELNKYGQLNERHSPTGLAAFKNLLVTQGTLMWRSQKLLACYLGTLLV